MVKSVFSLILHSPYVALALSMPIAKKPTTPVRRSQTPSASSGRLLEMHSNIREEVVELIKDQHLSYLRFIPPPGDSGKYVGATVAAELPVGVVGVPKVK